MIFIDVGRAFSLEQSRRYVVTFDDGDDKPWMYETEIWDKTPPEHDTVRFAEKQRRPEQQLQLAREYHEKKKEE